jgi:hypothetical protein
VRTIEESEGNVDWGLSIVSRVGLWLQSSSGIVGEVSVDMAEGLEKHKGSCR